MPRFWMRIAVAGWFALLAPKALADEATNDSLLLGRNPVASQGVAEAKRITDGRAVAEGTFWLTDQTARFRDKYAHVTYDLGGPVAIRCAFLQGDNDDTYEVSGSLDGKSYSPIFVASSAPGAGMRVRTMKLEATVRFVRVQALGGDGSYAVSEVGLLQHCPDAWPAKLQRVIATPVIDQFKNKVGWLAIAGVLLIVFFLGAGPRWLRLVAAAVPVLLAGSLISDLRLLYPFFDQEPILRATIALLAGALVAREFLLPKMPRLPARTSGAVLAMLAVLAMGCYYHFGAAQFWHAKEGRRTYVHSYDMRHYFPVAKYFPELGFDGLYAASFAAYLDLNQMPFERLGHISFRDLRVSQMKPAHEMRAHIEEVQRRFSIPRWTTFKQDIRTFVDIMGDRPFLENMNDHGGNATPAWLLGASAIVHSVPATETSLTLMGVFDPVLLVVMFFFIGRVFGWRTMGYVMVLFGATDFYQFGSNLMGSLLRQDWLVALGLGACAFRRRRGGLAGALFAYAGLVRAFPAMATFFFMAPAAWWIIDHLRTHKRLPSWTQFYSEHSVAVRAAVGAIGCVALFFGITLVIFGPHAWITWAEKISIHNSDVAVNNVGLRNVMAYNPDATARKLVEAGHPDAWALWAHNFYENLRSRAPIRYAILAAFMALAALVTRKRSPESAGLIGLTTIPFLFYPSNYYLHLIFLLPLAVPLTDQPRRFAQWVALLCALCVGQWATYHWAAGWHDEFFTYQSLILLGTFVLLLLLLASDASDRFRRLLHPRVEPASGPAPRHPASFTE